MGDKEVKHGPRRPKCEVVKRRGEGKRGEERRGEERRGEDNKQRRGGERTVETIRGRDVHLKDRTEGGRKKRLRSRESQRRERLQGERL